MKNEDDDFESNRDDDEDEDEDDDDESLDGLNIDKGISTKSNCFKQ